MPTIETEAQPTPAAPTKLRRVRRFGKTQREAVEEFFVPERELDFDEELQLELGRFAALGCV